MTVRAALPIRRPLRLAAALSLVATLAACGQGSLGIPPSDHEAREAAQPRRATIWDVFANRTDTNRTVAVNR